MDQVEAALRLAQEMVAARHPEATVALLSGSRARGHSRQDSDYDVVLLYEELPAGAWRSMEAFAGAAFEVFAHDLSTLRYFFQKIERPSGKPVLAVLLAEGVVVKDDPNDLISRGRSMAQAFLSAGPEPWPETTIDARRYAVTEMAESLRGCNEAGTELAIGSALHGALVEFRLRAAGRWNHGPKARQMYLLPEDLSFMREVDASFQALFCGEGEQAVQEVVDLALAEYGGRLGMGFRQQAPESWRSEI